MSRAKRLFAYFEKLNGLEKDIVMGKVAELLQDRVCNEMVKHFCNKNTE